MKEDLVESTDKTSVLQEVLGLRFLYLGMDYVAKSRPGAYVRILLGGIIKDNG